MPSQPFPITKIAKILSDSAANSEEGKLPWYGKTVGVIASKKDKTAETRDGPKELYELTIKDDTGEIGITIWEPKTPVSEGDTIEVWGAYTKWDDYNGAWVLMLSKKNSGYKKAKPMIITSGAPEVNPEEKKAQEPITVPTGNISSQLEEAMTYELRRLQRIVETGFSDVIQQMKELVKGGK